MNKCRSYKILCPYALDEIGRSASLPCVGTQEQCDKWREEYKK